MSQKSKITAILPIKGFSERIANKNFKPLASKPLFFWILESLLVSEDIDSIVINTDCPQRFKDYQLVQSPKIQIQERPKELQDDYIDINKIINYVLEHFSSETYIFTHVTNPLISTSTINAGIQKYFDCLEDGYDSLFSVNAHKKRFYDYSLKSVNHEPYNLLPTQHLSPLYEENSCLYIFSKKSFLKNNHRIGDSPYIFETPLIESFDIDTEEDWKVVEHIVQGINRDGNEF